MANKQTLTTLKSRSDFQNVFNNGQRIYPSSWMVANVCSNSCEEPRFGWTLPRYVGSAVTRNRLKRWCREFLRCSISDNFTKNIDVNFVFKRRDKEFYKRLSHEEFNKTIKNFFRKIK